MIESREMLEEPERTGRWIIKIDSKGWTYGECSNCGLKQYAGAIRECPFCGAKMETD